MSVDILADKPFWVGFNLVKGIGAVRLQALLGIIGNEPLHVDEIQAQSGLAVEKVSAALALMEFKGMLRQVGGMNSIAVRESRGDYQVGEQL